jgi:pSer/pThr/pTyr-binding forkhead associated (FHA) protein
MVQLKLLSGKMAGSAWEARRFPVRIGRSPSADLQIEESGVWDLHLNLDFRPNQGFVLRTEPNTLVSVNDSRVDQTVLRNGDVIQIGSARIQFWLSPTRQSGLRLHEWLNWVGIGIVTLGQIALIYWLLA